VSLIGLFYFLSGHLTYDSRLSAFYLSPNYLALFLAPAVFIGIYLIRQSLEKRKDIPIYPISLIIILINLYLTYSYAAWVSIILSFLVMLLIQKTFSRKLAITIILASMIVIAFQAKNEKFSNLFNNSERSSLSSRIMIWKSSLKILKDNPIFGIGPGNFQNKYLEYQKYFPPYLEWAVPEPHNLYLAFWLQSGILGIIGFLLIISAWLKNIIAEIKNQKNSPIFLAALFSIMLYILIHGLIDTPYWKNDLSVIFWIIFSLGILKEIKNFNKTSHLY
jgi:O-antigen ligase